MVRPTGFGRKTADVDRKTTDADWKTIDVDPKTTEVGPKTNNVDPKTVQLNLNQKADKNQVEKLTPFFPNMTSTAR